MSDEVDDRWLEQALRAAAPAPIADAGFSAAVMARVAPSPRVVSPVVALAAVRGAEQQLARQRRWNVGGVLVGAVVALLVVRSGAGAHDAASALAAAVATVLGSALLAWLAIVRE